MSSVVWRRHVFEIHWTPLLLGMRDTYGAPRELEVTVLLPDGPNMWMPGEIAAAVAERVGVEAHDVIRGS